MFFVRCYRTGAAKSGTTNVAEWDDCPNLSDFTETCEANGEGKYVLFQRGKGIRGMKKVNEHIVEIQREIPSPDSTNRTNNPSLSELLVFAAEEFQSDTNIAVKKNVATKDLDDSELLGVMESLADKKVSSAEEFEAFTKDIKALITEVKNRGMSSEGYSEAMQTKEAEKSSGLLDGKTGFFTGCLVGAVGGSLATAKHYQTKMAEMDERFGALETSLAETEKTLKKEANERAKEKKAAEAVRQFDNRLNLDASFLSNFNGNNGPQF
ncbi:hypothetical protein CMK18_21780 [Candidatus Poribacteria bacterium]|nr:hypothetical protein [Candidatus Poribacteria bacterium]